jgi:hypothetical protein
MIVLKQLHDILVECAHRFPVPLYGNEGKKVDKFVLTSAPEQLKVVVTLTGDSITHSVSFNEAFFVVQLNDNSLSFLDIVATRRTSASVFSGNRM